MRTSLKNTLFLIISYAISTAALAHTGHGTQSFMEGLTHPFGADHMLAMLAVGVWSVSALSTQKVWQGPATFMVAMVSSAALGASGVVLPLLEHAIALSVVLFGTMLIVSVKASPKGIGLSLIAAAASLHGLAHGAEAPASGFAAYASGFVLTTAILHLSGVAVGVGIRYWWIERSAAIVSSLGALVGLAGIFLFSLI
jgi:urease accessory protein